jgi:2-oxoglutarate ferredoxin oxidoreductase subunit alpha
MDEVDGAEIGIVAYGTTLYAIEEARHRLAAMGLKSSFMRLRALPVNDEVKEFIGRYDRVYVVELNRDGQLLTLLQTEAPGAATKLISLPCFDGLPLTARWVVEAIEESEQWVVDSGQ